MAQNMFGARKFMLDMLLKERSLDREALEECEKLRVTNRQSLAETLVSEGVVTDQELGLLLEKFAGEGHISPAELNLLMNEFPSSWERWKEMEEQDDAVASKIEEAEEVQPIPVEAVIEEAPLPDEDRGAQEAKDRRAQQERPLTERVHRGSLQEALEEMMEEAPVREYPSGRSEPAKEKQPAGPAAPAGEAPGSDSVIGKRIGGAKIISKVGEGQFGTVYKGVIEELGKTMAVRVISSDMIDEARRASVLQYAQTATRIEHRNVAQISTAGEAGNSIYIVSTFVDGETLRARLKRESRIEQKEVLDIGLQVARALRAGHDNEIYHGDVKPENIFFDKEGMVVVTDFGLAKSAEIGKGAGSKQSLLQGTPQYMAPEQFEARLPDARTDIYSLGVTLFEMLTGVRPFEGATAFAIRDAHHRGSPKLVTEVDKALSPTIAKLVAKMIAKDPDDRYREMTQLVNDMVDLKQYMVAGGAEPPVALGAVPGSPAMDPDVRARAKKYKTVGIMPPQETRKFKFRYVVIILLVLTAAGGGAYIYFVRPDLIKLQGGLGEQAFLEFEDIKHKADLMHQERRFLAAIWELDKLKPEHMTGDVQRTLDVYRDEIFDKAIASFAERQEKVKKALDEDRIEDAMRMNRAFKWEVERILLACEERWPKVAGMKEYAKIAQNVEKEINQTREMEESFEKDVKSAGDFLKQNTLDAVAEARGLISKYIEIRRTGLRTRAKEFMEEINAREQFLKRQAKDKERMEEFKEMERSARKDMAQGEFAGARSRVDQFKNSDSVIAEYVDKLLADTTTPLPSKVLSPTQQTIIIDVVRFLSEVGQKEGEYDAIQAEKQRREQFQAEIKHGYNLIEQGKYNEVLDIIIADYRKEDSRLSEKEKEDLAQLEAQARHHIKFMEEFGEIEGLLSSVSNLNGVLELIEEEKYRKALEVVVETYDKDTRLTQVQEDALSKLEPDPREMVRQGKYGAALEAVIKEYRNDPRLAEQVKEALLKVREKEAVSKLEPEARRLIGQGKFEDLLKVIIEMYNSDRYLSVKERKAFSKLKTGADSRGKLAGVLAGIADALSEKKLKEARGICLPWRLDPRKKLKSTANRMYIEIMSAREPGMVFIEGGMALIGSYNDAVERFIEALKSDDEEVKRKAVEDLEDMTKQNFGDDYAKWKAWNQQNKDDNNPERRKVFHTFYMDHREVTCQNYAKFIKDGNLPPPPNWPRGLMPRQWARLPVTGITLKDAAAYAKWAGKRLPTEEEWEIAASWEGKNKRLYPWGNKYAAGNANIATGKLEDVTTRKKDVSALDLFDMAGNAAEWTATKAGDNYIVRGGSADKASEPRDTRTSRRSFLDPNTRGNFLGFRCAKDVR